MWFDINDNSKLDKILKDAAKCNIQFFVKHINKNNKTSSYLIIFLNKPLVLKWYKIILKPFSHILICNLKC